MAHGPYDKDVYRKLRAGMGHDSALALAETLGSQNAAFVRPGSVGDRLRKAAAVASTRSLDAMASPPTITTGTSNLDATLTKSYRIGTVGRSMYRVVGGQAQMGTGGYAPYLLAPSVTKPSNNGDTPGMSSMDTIQWAVEFMTDAPKVMLRYFGSNLTYMIQVDDQPVSATELTFPGAGMTGYTLLDFGGVEKIRKITVELQHNMAFDGVYVGPTYTIWAPISDTNLRVANVGDSICTGTGGTLAGGTWSSVAAKLLGWTDIRQIAIGGTGFVNTNGTAGNTFGSSQRVADVVATNPDLLVVTVSGNDDGLSGVQAAALSCFQAYRSALPKVPIVVLGPFGASTNASAARVATSDAAKAAFDQWADANSWWIPNVKDPAGSWDTGTGYVGATKGDGNRDRYGNDAAHPNNAGHRFYGKRFANAFRSTVLSAIP